MANPNPHKARQAKQARRSAGTIADVQNRLWKGVEAACAVLDDPEADLALRLRAVHAITQATAAYARVLEASDFEGRLQTIEKSLLGHGGLI